MFTTLDDLLIDFITYVSHWFQTKTNRDNFTQAVDLGIITLSLLCFSTWLGHFPFNGILMFSAGVVGCLWIAKIFQHKSTTAMNYLQGDAACVLVRIVWVFGSSLLLLKETGQGHLLVSVAYLAFTLFLYVIAITPLAPKKKESFLKKFLNNLSSTKNQIVTENR